MRVPRGVPSIDDGRPLPDVLDSSPELVAVGGAMTVERLLEAYSKGIFPWSVKPVTWKAGTSRSSIAGRTTIIPDCRKWRRIWFCVEVEGVA